MSIFQRRPSGAPEFLIVGLGNPGKKYERTRHNLGFLCVDELARRHDLKINKIKFQSRMCDCVINGVRCVVLKPETFMNSSGIAVEECASFYKIPPEKIIIIFDDVDIPFADVRVKQKGSAGSHNGIKSIVGFLNSENFPRVKIGAGGKLHPDYDLKDFVLSRLTEQEMKDLAPSLEKACDAVEYIIRGEIDHAMERCQVRNTGK
ncbi:MAG: aminoacyl-tRNA hydrolase [Clostridia bacterium]|nr:aminoacyl-tRNA hydrolase [Clostridia bacterium]